MNMEKANNINITNQSLDDGVTPKAEHLELLMDLEKKAQAGEQFTKDALVFLYEIDSPARVPVIDEKFGYIPFFGYDHERISKILSARNPEQDMPIVFECSPEQIAHNPEQIGKNTKAYVGPLEEGIFSLIKQHNVEYIYSSFPEGKIKQYNISVGGKEKAQIIKELEEKNIDFSRSTKDLLESNDFTTLKEAEQVHLVRLKVKDLGFTDNNVHMDHIYQKAQELGLELCEAEVAPNLSMQYPGKEEMRIAMNPINDPDGYPATMIVGRKAFYGDRVQFDAKRALTYDEVKYFDLDNDFVFSLSKQNEKTGA